jgi:hypothetical protein
MLQWNNTLECVLNQNRIVEIKLDPKKESNQLALRIINDPRSKLLTKNLIVLRQEHSTFQIKFAPRTQLGYTVTELNNAEIEIQTQLRVNQINTINAYLITLVQDLNLCEGRKNSIIYYGSVANKLCTWRSDIDIKLIIQAMRNDQNLKSLLEEALESAQTELKCITGFDISIMPEILIDPEDYIRNLRSRTPIIQYDI